LLIFALPKNWRPWQPPLSPRPGRAYSIYYFPWVTKYYTPKPQNQVNISGRPENKKTTQKWKKMYLDTLAIPPPPQLLQNLMQEVVF